MADAGPEIERLISLLAKLPGMGPRSARRAALALLKKREALMQPLSQALSETAERVKTCGECGALTTTNPCRTCSDATREADVLCVVEDDADLWAMERARAFRGRYHVLGGLLSAMDGVGPETLRVESLLARAARAREVILALPATVDGQTTALYLAERLAGTSALVTSLARGVPVGGELGWLDDGTIVQALRARRPAGGP